MKKLVALVLAVAMLLIPMTSFAATASQPPRYYPDYTENVTYVSPTTAYVVVCRALNVRADASTAKAPIEIIHRGDVINVLAIEGNWAKVETTDGSAAYVYTKYIEKA